MFRKLLPYLSITLLALAFVSETEAQSLQLKTQWCNTTKCAHKTKGIFVVWWDRKYEHNKDATFILNELIAVRKQALQDYKMKDPPNIGRGYYFNIYIHRAGKGIFPRGWNNGVGTDKFRNPFLTLPHGFHTNKPNLAHEGFHIFQYRGNVTYGGDTGWYIEATANWNRAVRNKDYYMAYPGSRVFIHHPQLQMWHSAFNAEVKNWGRGMHNYAMGAFLYYLSAIRGVSGSVIGKSIYEIDKKTTPQEYLYSRIGPETFRRYWMDFQESILTGKNFMSSSQIRAAKGEYAREMRGKNDDQSYVTVLKDRGQRLIKPDRIHAPRPWGFNVIRINNSMPATYSIHFRGKRRGEKGTRSHFKLRIIKVSGKNKVRRFDVKLKENRMGHKTVRTSGSGGHILILIGAMPSHFRGNQRFFYSAGVQRIDSRGNPGPPVRFEKEIANFNARSISGTYHRDPVQNGYHKGKIQIVQEGSKGATLEWHNAAGVSWNLYYRKNNPRLKTGTRNPYYKINPRTGREFILEFDSAGKIRGFRFQNEFFRRK